MNKMFQWANFGKPDANDISLGSYHAAWYTGHHRKIDGIGQHLPSYTTRTRVLGGSFSFYAEYTLIK